MIKTALAAVLVSLVMSGAAVAQDACEKLKGPEKAACKQAAKEAAGKTNMGRSEEMRGLGAQGKGQGAENGKGVAGEAKDKAEKKAKDMKEEAKDGAKDKAADRMKKGGE